MWDYVTRKEVLSFHVEKEVRDVVVSTDEQSLAVASDDRTLFIRRLTDGAVQDLGALHRNPIQGVAFLPGSRLIATAATDAPTIKLWDIDTRGEVTTLRSFNLVIRAISSSPDGKRLAATSLGLEPVKLWDTASWEEVANLEVFGQPLWLRGFSPDGDTLMATDSKGGLHLWRAPPWTEIAAAEAKEKPETKQR